MGTIVIAGDDLGKLIGQRKPVYRGLTLAEAGRIQRGRPVSVFRARTVWGDIEKAFTPSVSPNGEKLPPGIWMHTPNMGRGDVLLAQNGDGFDWYDDETRRHTFA